MRIEVEEGLGGSEMRDPGLDPRGIMVIIDVRVVVKHHAVSEALGEWSQKDAGVEP